MASENKKINELVSEDDETTAELEILSLDQVESGDTDVALESEEYTYGLSDGGERKTSRAQTIPELRSDLDARTETIGRLQYDIEQLRSRWLGLEAEISAREEIVSNLTHDVDNLKDRMSRKDKLLRKRKKEMASLKSDLRQRDASHDLLTKEHALLDEQLTDLRSVDAEHVAALEAAVRETENVRSELESTQKEIASLRSDIKQREDRLAVVTQERAELDEQLTELRSADAEHVSALETAIRDNHKIGTDLETARRELGSLSSDLKQRDESYASLKQEHADLEQQYAGLEQRILSLEGQHAELDTQLTEHRSSSAKKTLALGEAERELDRLQAELAEAREQNKTEVAIVQQNNAAAVKEVESRLLKAEEYADTLRFKFQDLSDAHTGMLKIREELESTATKNKQRASELADELEIANQTIGTLQAQLEKTAKDNEQEMRTLRFELGEAQSTFAETSQLNTELASNLMDTRGHKQNLEETLREKETKANARIAELESQVKKLTREAEDFEQKLDTKSTAINVLLGELAKKSEQMESIGEIEDVIQEIDDRMSGRFDGSADSAAQSSATSHASNDRERITRVLVGSIGEQELRFPLFTKRLTIGRTEENDIQLKESYVSRNHAVVLTEGEKTRVIDWGSKNGVFVNKKRVKEHFLSNGDIVTIGNTKFRYEERKKRDA